MILKEIELNGFKSFKGKTRLSFDSEVVSLVGPNGAGKSNVVDAIKWLLGEPSNKEIRTTNTSGLIFSSPDDRERLDVCSVAITVENPSEFDEWREGTYRVEKRYYRDEDSEYLINGSKVRLKDIRRLLNGLGVSLDNLSIVSQGEIGTFLSLVPTDRRVVFEEVAQLGHFKANKRRILNDLDRTAHNLERLEDNLVDRRKLRTQLKEEADVAKNHSELSEKLLYRKGNLLALDLIHCERTIARHENKIDLNREELTKIETDLKNYDSSIRNIEGEIETMRASREEAIRASEEYQREIEAKRHNLEKIELAIEHKRESLVAKKLALDEKERQKILIGEEAQGDKSRIEDLTVKKEKTISDETSTRETHMKRMEDLRAAKGEYEESINLFEELKKEINEKQRNLSEIELRINALTEAASGLEKTVAKLNSEKGERSARIGSVREEATIVTEDIDSVRDKKGKAQSKLEKFEGELEIMRERFSELIKSESSCNAELAVLGKLESEREGIGDSVKAILSKKEKSDKFSGIIGTLSDLISVKPGYEFALEAIMGGRLMYLVAETKLEAIAAIDWVKNEGTGQVSIIPLDVIEPIVESIPSEIESDEGFILNALEALEFEPRFEKAIRYAVGNSLIVRKLQDGLRLRDSSGVRSKMATLDGDLIFPEGVLRGGKARMESGGILVRKARITKLNEDKLQLRKDMEAVSQEIVKVDRASRDLRAETETQDEQLSDLLRKKVEYDGRISSIESSISDIESRLQELVSRGDADKERFAELKAAGVVLDAEIESLIGRVDVENTGLTEIRIRIDEETSELHRERTRLERYAILSSSYAEEILRLQEGMTRKVKEMQRIDDEIALARTAGVEFEKSITGMKQTTRDHKVEIENLRAGFPEIKEKEKEIESEISQKREHLNQSHQKRGVLIEEKATFGEEIHKSEVKLASLASERQSYRADLTRRFPRVFEDLEAGKLEAKELGAKGALRDEITKIDNSLAELGEVNHLAISQYERVTEELDFKEEQREDLIKSAEELKKNLEEVEKKSCEVFLEVFNKTNQHFDALFRKLFPGGQAAISLIDPDDPLESGIDIRARFPGKKEVDIIQFSGGEKAMVALVLVFAILKVKPSSFTLLDEVEAALDDVNVGKFLTLVNDFLPDRQFIIITLNKGTMEYSKLLYGITMRRDGISRVVSVNLNQWDEKVLGVRTGGGLDKAAPILKRLPIPKPN